MMEEIPANMNDRNIDQDTALRIEQGKEGKLWCITVLCKDGAITRNWCRVNQRWGEIQKIRKALIEYGLMIPIDPGHYVLILPWDLLDVRIERQKTLLHYDPAKG